MSKIKMSILRAAFHPATEDMTETQVRLTALLVVVSAFSFGTLVTNLIILWCM